MQHQIRQFINTHGLNCGPESRFIDLASEVGELGKEILKATAYGRKPFTPGPGCQEEMGDCLFSLLALCCETGIDAAEALEGALDKYRARLRRRGDAGSEN